MEGRQVAATANESQPQPEPTPNFSISYVDCIKSRLARLPSTPSAIVVPSLLSDDEPSESVSAVSSTTTTDATKSLSAMSPTITATEPPESLSTVSTATERCLEISTAATSVLSLPQLFLVQKFYVSPTTPIDKKIQSVWTQRIKSRLSAVLLHTVPTGTCIQELMMVGKTPNALKPTIVATCGDAETKKKVETAFKGQGWLQTLLRENGIIFIAFVAKTRLSMGLASDLTDAVMISECFSVLLPPGRVATSCGLPLLVKTSETKPQQYCTLGGLVMVNGEIFGLTAGHPFQAHIDNRFDQGGLVEDDGGSEDSEPFVFNDDNDGHDDSPRMSHSITLPGSFYEPANFSSTPIGDATVIQHDLSKAFASPAKWTQSCDAILPLPNPTKTLSFEDPLGECDWALLKMASHAITTLPNKIAYTDPQQDIPVERTISWPSHGEVTIIIASIGVQLGSLHSSPVTMKVNSSVLNLQLITLEHILPLGSSGAWVILDEQLCGIIIAIRQDVPWAYMMPIEPVLQDIKKKLGTTDVRLPKRNEIESIAVSSVPRSFEVPATQLHPDMSIVNRQTAPQRSQPLAQIAQQLGAVQHVDLNPALPPRQPPMSPVHDESEVEAGPSTKRRSIPKIPAFEFAANIEKFERLKQEVGATLLPAISSKGGDHRRPRSINGQHLPWFDVETQGWNQSPTSSGFPPQPPKKTKLYEYNKIWRSNYTLSLDGGGVRGYSQLIIIKALMDEVARIERSRPDENGNTVESSFHPFSPKDEKSIIRPKSKHRRRKMKKMKKEASTNSLTNGDTGEINRKGKEVGRQSDLSMSDEEEGDKFYPYHYFDYIAGTSTGGLNAIMLGRLRMSVDECLKGFPEMARRVFGKPRFASYRFSPLFWFCAKYSGNRLRDVVKDVVDEHLCEGEGYMLAMNKEMCRTVVLAIKRNLNNHETAHLFRTYDHHRRKVLKDKPMDPFEQTGPADSSLIWEVARATSAAPTYFNTIKIGEDEYGGAGFGENNPSKRLFWEVSHMNNNNDNANALSISIGTGITRFSRFQTGFLKKPIGWINAAKAVSTDCEKAHLEMQNIHKHKYFRFNVPEKATDPDPQEPSKWQYIKKRTRRWIGHGGEPLDRGLGKIKLDEWKSRGWWRKESTQEEIKRITEEYLKDPEVVKELKEIAEMMVSHRRARARTDRWAAYALGIRYECPITFERCPDDTWTDERHLRRHLVEDHEITAGNTQADEYLEQFLRAGKYFEDHH